MNYTKGEWEAGQGIIKGFEDTEHIVVGLKGTNNTKIICATGFSNAKDVEESIANAHLISAAPELYEALKNLVDRGLIRDLDGDHFYEVMDALRKAEGRE
jgi:hypothetical protein